LKQYIIRRLLLALVILFGVSILLYAIVRLMPGDYVETITRSNPNVTPQMVQHLKSLYGLDTGMAEGYIKWLGNALQGDLGESFVYKQPVTQVISSRMWTSFSLAFIAFVFELILAIPLGILAATKQYSKTDYAVTFFSLIGISLPSFFFAAILKRIFSVGLGWLPLNGMVSARADYVGFDHIVDVGIHFILPITVLVVINMGSLMRFSRTNMLEVLNADYIRTARAKGLSEHSVIYRHAFRNTLIPIITLIGTMLPALFSGAIITETIFAIPGLGNTAFNAMTQGDIPFIMGFNVFLAALTLLGTLLSDILYAVVDPRIRYS